MKVLAFLPDAGGCGFYRQRQPLLWLNALAGTGPSFKHWESVEHGGPELLRWADVVLVSRIQALGPVRNIRDYNPDALLVFDLDDYLLLTPDENPFTQWTNPFQLECLKANIEGADLVTVSTEPLKKLLSEYNDNIAVIPNTIDPRLFDWPEMEKDHIRVGWAGSSTHVRDVEPAMKGMKLALDEWNRRAEHDAGRSSKKRREAGQDPSADICRPAVMGHLGRLAARLWQGEQIFWQPPVSFDQYYRHLHGLALDIGLAPIREHVFNKCKSDIKFQEYSAMNALTIATDYGPYADTIKHEQTGLLIKQHDNPRQWRDLILYALEEEEERRRWIKNAREFCLDHRSPEAEVIKLRDIYMQALIRKRNAGMGPHPNPHGRSRGRTKSAARTQIRVGTVSWIPEPDERLLCVRKCLPIIISRLFDSKTPITYRILLQDSCKEAHTFVAAEVELARKRGLDIDLITRCDNRGVPAINDLFAAADEPYFMKIDDDVIPAPGFLDVMMEVYTELQNRGELIGMLSYDPAWGPETFGTRDMMKVVSRSMVTRDGHYLNFLEGNSTAVGMCRMESAESFRKVGGHPEDVLYGTDQLMADAYWEVGYENAHLIPVMNIRKGVYLPMPLEHLGPTSAERKEYKKGQLRKMNEKRKVDNGG